MAESKGMGLPENNWSPIYLNIGRRFELLSEINLQGTPHVEKPEHEPYVDAPSQAMILSPPPSANPPPSVRCSHSGISKYIGNNLRLRCVFLIRRGA